MRTDVALPDGLSGHAVRGLADTAAPAPGVAEAAAQASPGAGGDPAAAASIGDTVRAAAEEIVRGLDLAGRALGESVDAASGMAFARAAEVAPTGTASSLGQTAFSWSGYVQAVGILCLLLAALWLVLWLVRRYGRFNFLPRPGALPRGALVMEAQMPLGPRKGLMVVRFLNTRLLLGVTEQQICLLKEEDVHDEPRDNDFQGIMDQARRGVADSGGPAGPAA